MKKTWFLLPLLAAAWLTLLIACNGHKDPPPTPEPNDQCPSFPAVTTEGLGTFGCKIDGVEWIPCIQWWSSWTSRPIECRAGKIGSYSFIDIVLDRYVTDSTYSNIDQNVLFSISIDTLEIGKYSLVNSNSNFSIKLSEDSGLKRIFNSVDSISNNFIEILKVDTSSKIVSGTFQFTLIEKNTGEKIVISDGRFDLKFLDP